MNLEVGPFNEQSIEDFKNVVRDRFSEGATALAEKVLSNPIRVRDSDSGAIGYEDGTPVCVRASIIRKVYLGHDQFFGTVGGLLAKKHGSDRSLLKQVVKNSVASRDGSKMFYTNTSVKACVKLNNEAGIIGHGPDHWASVNIVVYRPLISWWIRFSSIHPSLPRFRFPIYKFNTADAFEKQVDCGKIIRRELSLNGVEINAFWTRYLGHNTGLVSSRSFNEINWAYGSRLKSNVIFIALRDSGSNILGYIVASYSDGSGFFWKIIDWIAIDNDLGSLDLMMGVMVDYIREMTPAVELSISGFPSCVQSIISKYATRKDSVGHNPYLFHCYDRELLAKISLAEKTGRSWFWGPYDGDMCME